MPCAVPPARSGVPPPGLCGHVTPPCIKLCDDRPAGAATHLDANTSGRHAAERARRRGAMQEGTAHRARSVPAGGAQTCTALSSSTARGERRLRRSSSVLTKIIRRQVPGQLRSESAAMYGRSLLDETSRATPALERKHARLLTYTPGQRPRASPQDTRARTLAGPKTGSCGPADDRAAPESDPALTSG